MMVEWQRAQEVAESAARRAGQKLLELLGQVNPREKAPQDLVSEADYVSQQMIAEELQNAFPEFALIGEETTPELPANDWEALQAGQPTWIVDPLDGTLNYVHQLPGFAVSIGLAVAGVTRLGVIYDPQLNELFVGRWNPETAAGEAWLNGASCQTSGCRELERALIAASLPPRVTREAAEMQRFVEVATCCRSLRRMGSAALNLAYVATGRLDAYWATTVNAWDVAAGWALVQAAGGLATSAMGGPLDLRRADFIVAATRPLHQQLTTVLEKFPAVASNDQDD